jgi:hypothetical protein
MTAALVAHTVPNLTAQLAAESGVSLSSGATADDLRTATASLGEPPPPGCRSGSRREMPAGAGPATQGQAKSNRPARPGMPPETSRTPPHLLPTVLGTGVVRSPGDDRRVPGHPPPAGDQPGAPGADPGADAGGAPGADPAVASGAEPGADAGGAPGADPGAEAGGAPGADPGGGPGEGAAAATPASPPVSATATSADAANVRTRMDISFGRSRPIGRNRVERACCCQNVCGFRYADDMLRANWASRRQPLVRPPDAMKERGLRSS